MKSAETKLAEKANKQPISNTTLLLTITICTFVLMYLLGMVIWGGGFLNPQQFFDIFNNNSYLICIACGMTLVMITGGIDISVAGTVALVTMCCVCYMRDHATGIFSCILISVGIGLAMGLFQGFLITYLKIQPFIISLAGLFFTRGMTVIVSKEPVNADPNNPAFAAFLKVKEKLIEFKFIGKTNRLGEFIPSHIEVGVIISLFVVLLLWAMLKYTRFGRNLYAIGGNKESALMLGINVQRTEFFAYALCGLLAGIGGFCYLLHTGAGTQAAASQGEMQAIASSIIGGTLLTGGVGSVIGTLFGVMSLKTINTIVVASGLREPYWQSITTGLMLCFFILMQSIILDYRKKKLGNIAG